MMSHQFVGAQSLRPKQLKIEALLNQSMNTVIRVLGSPPLSPAPVTPNIGGILGGLISFSPRIGGWGAKSYL